MERYDDRIREILSTADLEVITTRSVREQLKAETDDPEIDTKKKELDTRILAMLDELGPEETDDEENDVKEEVVAYQAKRVKTEPSSLVKVEPLPSRAPSGEPGSSSQGRGTTTANSTKGIDGSDDSEPDGADRLATKKRGVTMESTTARPRTKTKIKSDDFIDDSDDSEGGGMNRLATKKRRATSESTNGFTRALACSPELSHFLGGVAEISRPETVKRIWAYVREHELQDASDRRYIILDHALRPLFGRNRKRVQMFTMNKLLAGHLRKPEDIASGTATFEGPNSDSDEEATATPSQGRKASTKKPAASKRASDGGAPKPNGLMKPKRLSDKLAAVVGTSVLPRPHVVKALWVYIKSKGLQSPTDGRMIHCDAALQSLFGVKSVTAFKMNTYLSQHLSSLSDDEGS
ncbi:hypothetical protein HKX48_004729 [Thoreauomyces humboldtii]|nr:hypothetical protein HKX48_004729 [Thoreauomyces humboldtii]